MNEDQLQNSFASTSDSTRIKVLLVDDEPIAIDRMTKLLQWASEGFDLLPHAINGQQALTIIEKMMPDIVIADIEMPVMGGLELCSAIKKRWKNRIRVLLLTACSDFHYMQQSIEFGVDRYLLKSEISKESLLQTLSETVESLAEERKKYRHHMLQSLVAGYITADMDQNEIYQGQHLTLLFVQQIKPILFGTNRSHGKDKQIIPEQKQLDDISSSLSCMGSGILETVGLGNNTWCILLYVSTTSILHLHMTVARAAASLNHLFRDMHHIEIRVCAVSTKGFLSEIEERLSKIKIFSESRHYFENEGVLWYSPDIIKENDSLEDNCFISDVQNAVLSGKAECVRKLMDKESIPRHRSTLEKRVSAVLLLLSQENPECLDNMSEPIYDATLAWKQLTILLENTANKIVSKKQYSAKVKKAIDYIDENYKNKICTSDIADAVYLSEIYISLLFKKETGSTLTDYLSKKRISAAKKLLKTSDMKIYEIATAVGYTTSPYFATAFKKITGVSPLEYRNGRDDV